MEVYKITSFKSLYFKYSGILFCAFVVLLYAFTYNYAVESLSLKIILIIVYFVITTMLLFGIYKSKGEVTNLIAVLILPILMIPMFSNPILLIPLIGLLFLYFRFEKWKIICLIALVIFVYLYNIVFFISVLSGMVLITDIEKIPSPDGQHILILREVDEGALGGSVSVFVEKIIPRKSFLGIVKRATNKEKNRKRLYHGRWGDKPKISWIDNETVEVNGVKFNIFSFEE